MPELSRRALAMPASPIRKLVPFADAAGQRGTRVFQLNIGQPDIPTPPCFLDAIQQARPEVVAYSPSQGLLTLRERIAAYYAGLGHSLTTDQILVTTGASEALSFVFASVMNPGDELIVPEPFYANYLSFCLGHDARVVPVTCRIEDHFALPSPEEFAGKITERTRAILICNPVNPTGVVYPPAALEQLRNIALEHGLYVIADEVYREFVYGDNRHQSCLALEGMEQNTVVVDSISKRFSACGARIGCVVSRNSELMDAVLRMAQARLSPPTLGQLGAEALYQLPEEYYQGVNHEYAARCQMLQARLNRIPGVTCPEVVGAFYAMVRLPVDNAERFCHWILEEFEHNGATVMLAPGSGFYATPDIGQDEVRIAYVLKQDDLAVALDCLEAALRAYPGNTLGASQAAPGESGQAGQTSGLN